MALWLVLSAAQAHASIRWEQSGSDQAKQYTLSHSNGSAYDTRFLLKQGALIQQIQSGHPQQLGRLEIDQNKVTAYRPDGQIVLNSSRQQSICLPELFGEFIRLHRQALTAGKTLRCQAPIIKAAKLAPFKVRQIKTSASRRTFEISPGSIGMSFFMRPIYLETDLAIKRIHHYQGALPMTKSASGKLDYLVANWSSAAGLDITDFVHPSMR
ncbi:hypothetical protein ACTSKR_13880 [Chitinibacteraceae bacterium HSL-7]